MVFDSVFPNGIKTFFYTLVSYNTFVHLCFHPDGLLKAYLTEVDKERNIYDFIHFYLMTFYFQTLGSSHTVFEFILQRSRDIVLHIFIS